MGIPAFYRWLVERYPQVINDAIEEKPVTVNGVEVPIDTRKPNPNEMEFDNLYLDMNGIIHPCFHPENRPQPQDYEEVFEAVFRYIDHIFSIIRPRKLLFMAIDGVAPRAKMNQQRTRRFRAAKEAADLAAAAEEAKLKSGESKLDASEETHKLDSNVITPGTEFMALLSSALQYYVHLRMNNDQGWRGIKVILSDATIPGEGEHKIMSYIRLQRNLPGFDPNTRHCLYGLDADLIMLALTTHEIHFSILREDISRQFLQNKPVGKQKYLLLHIWVLRDYLSYDLRVPNSTMNTDLERLIDDFVFMCVFVGNDFLPNVPSLNIHEGAIDLLMTVYKREFDKMGGYLTNSFEVNLKRVEHFLQIVGSHEDAIFRKRTQESMEWERRGKRMEFRNKNPARKGITMWSSSNPNIPKPICLAPGTINNTTIDGKIVVVDNIKLGEKGWKGRFYAEKFEAKNEDAIENIRKLAVLKYIEGICWVMRYYFEGVCSWQWFYPYHYSPFASDFHGLDRLEIHFTLGEPFKPFDQLMGVLPAASAHALPSLYRNLMTDPMSPILDFYPTDFELDMNGKRHEWQAVCKLPFIKESRLLAEIANVEHSLTDEERKRNSLGLDFLYVHISHSLATKILSFYKRKKDHPKLTEAKVKRKINPNFSGGMNGYMYISAKPVLELEVISPMEGIVLVNKNEVICVFYKLPPVHPHIPRPPKGVVIPKMSVSKEDVERNTMLWHEDPRLCRRIRGPIIRPIRNAFSGPSFAKSAHQLVKKHYFEKKKQTMTTEKLDDHTITDASCLTDSKETVCKEMVGNDEKINLNGIKPGKKKKRKIDGDEYSIQNVDNDHVNADPSCQMNSIENVTEKRMGKDERRDVNGTKPGKKRKLRDASCQSNTEETLLGNDETSDVNGTKPENTGKLKDVVNGDDQSIKKVKKQKKNMPVQDDEQDIKGKKLKKKSILVEDNDQNIKDKKPKQKVHFEEDDGKNIKEKRKMKSSLVLDDGEDTKEKKQKMKSSLVVDDVKDTKEKKQKKKSSLVLDDVEDTKEKKKKKKSTLIEDGEQIIKKKKEKKKSTLIEDGEQIIKKKKEKKKKTHLEDPVLVN